MAIKKVSKNLSAGPSKATKKAGPVDPNGAYTKVQERTLGNMKMGGKMKKATSGTSLKPVDKAKNPGLSKLPTPVRNKMGYQKMGGKTSKKK